ncbi:MAG TPA: peptide deformylase [Parcubacteria group bacterium]|nr:peptide deformylase [Parcubacteria group bacterium]
MVKKILQKEEKVLREIAKNVSIDEIKSEKIQKIISEMKEALNSQDDGVAIAAPQIGYSLRIFVVSKKVEEIVTEAKLHALGVSQELIDEELKKVGSKDMVFINPVMKKLSKDKKNVEEGCLSVRYLYGLVKRSTKATVEALDENGRKFQRGGTGLLAQIFQHEMDHLDGVLFIDKASNVEEIPPEKIK